MLNERELSARELHDGIGQVLSGEQSRLLTADDLMQAIEQTKIDVKQICR